MVISSVHVRPGDSLNFPGSSLNGFARVEILDANNVVVASGVASVPLQAQSLGLTFDLAESSAGLFVAVRRSGTFLTDASCVSRARSRRAPDGVSSFDGKRDGSCPRRVRQ